MLRADKMTVKTQEALVEAQELARFTGHGSIEAEHLFRALLEQEGGLVAPILQKIGADTAIIRDRVEGALKKLPKVSGNTQIFISPVLNRVLEVQKQGEYRAVQEHDGARSSDSGG